MKYRHRTRRRPAQGATFGGRVAFAVRFLAALFALAGLDAVAPAPAGAASLTVQINDDTGHPLPFAVVGLMAADGSVPRVRPPAGLTATIIDQRDETFVPYVVAITKGGSVTFRNSDTTRHHVYTFAPIHPFEFILKPGDVSPPQVFDKPGIAAIGCNIHDHMIAYVYVSDTPLVAVSGHDGKAVIADVPPGRYAVQVWYPQLKPGITVAPVTAVIAAIPVDLTVPVPAIPFVDDMMDGMN